MVLDAIGSVHVSMNEGQTWREISAYDEFGSDFYLMVQHPFVAGTAFLLSSSGYNVILENFGATQRPLGGEASPWLVPFYEPFAFCKTNPQMFLFIADVCQAGACHSELYITTDGGRTLTRVQTYVNHCFFGDAAALDIVDPMGMDAIYARSIVRLTTRPSSAAIYCTVSRSKVGDMYDLDDYDLIKSDDRFATSGVVLEGAAYAIPSGRYVVAVNLQGRFFISSDGATFSPAVLPPEASFDPQVRRFCSFLLLFCNLFRENRCSASTIRPIMPFSSSR